MRILIALIVVCAGCTTSRVGVCEHPVEYSEMQLHVQPHLPHTHPMDPIIT